VIFARAASSGFGVQLEAEAIRAALQYLGAIQKRGQLLSVNASPRAASSYEVQALLAGAPEDLVIEITEQDQVESYLSLNRSLLRLRIEGLRVAIDDVGSGFANWGHVIHLQPDVIKLDGAWTRDVEADPSTRALVRALVGLAGDIDALVIAEQLETAGQVRMMQELGVELGQGYHICRPRAFAELLAEDPVP
jgi:EAL domain-containing protein (putative c-di-GMP-specific phosphodiesterase class I)